MEWIAIIGLIIGAVSALSGSLAQQRQYEANAKANDYNAAVLRQRAELTASTYNQREEQQRRVARLQAGELRASIAESGSGLLGSNADVERQSQIFAEMDSLNIRYEGELESSALLEEATLQDFEAKVNRANSRYTKRTLPINVAAGALMGYSAGAGASRYGSSGRITSSQYSSRYGGSAYGGSNAWHPDG